MQPYLVGLIVAHAAFPAVFVAYPERQQDGVDGYVALSDSAEIGNRYVLVRQGVPDMLVAVADCAAAQHVARRAAEGLIADVQWPEAWTGGYFPQMAELWRVDDRARWCEKWLEATNEH